MCFRIVAYAVSIMLLEQTSTIKKNFIFCVKVENIHITNQQKINSEYYCCRFRLRPPARQEGVKHKQMGK